MYLKAAYGENEPIYIEDIRYENILESNIHQQIRKLIEDRLIKQFDEGICFIPKKSIFREGSRLSVNAVVEKRYLWDGDKRCGYFSGVGFANQLRLITQVPMICEIVTNKAIVECNEVKIAKSRVIIRKPKIMVNELNYQILQFLDLLETVDDYAEIEDKELDEQLREYLKSNSIKFEEVKKYLGYYGNRVWEKYSRLE